MSENTEKESREMRRRRFMSVLAASSVAGISGCLSDDSGGGNGENGSERGSGDSTGQSSSNQSTGGDRISTLSFYSPASQISTDGGDLSDEYAVVRGSETASSIDTTDSNPYMYEEGSAPPLSSEDGKVVGFGSTELVSDSNGGFEYGNEEFVLNAIEMKTEGDTILWDGGHDQYWSLDRYTIFRGYAEEEGYTIRPTSSMESDLSDADGIVITSPSSGFTDSELESLSEFVNNGGAVFLMDQSDFQGHDETGNLNEIAEALNIGFRFNSDQINDSQENAGSEFIPTTSNFVGPSEYFVRRSSRLQPGEVNLDKSREYEVPVTEVTDGDTMNVVFGDASTDTIRFLGIDTPELNEVARIQEWTGIEDENHLVEWAERATEFAREELAGETVKLVFDEEEPTRGTYGRVLAYVYYDSTGNGEYDTDFCLEAVKQGYARAYSSGFGRHDEFAVAEEDAFQEGRGLWEASDLGSMSEYRNSDVESLFFPNPVAAEGGDVVVSSENTSSPAESPLVAVDEDSQVAVLGAPIMEESYETGEGFGADVSGHDNFTFLTNLAYGLSDLEGNIFFEGGHRQFNTEGSLCAEDAAYYGRHLEGFGRRLRQVNSLPETLSEAEAASLLISPPASSYTESEMKAVEDFVSRGGSVILIGNAKSSNIGKLNEIAERLGSNAMLSSGERVTDQSNSINNDRQLISTSNFNESYQFFSKFSESSLTSSRTGPLTLPKPRSI